MKFGTGKFRFALQVQSEGLFITKVSSVDHWQVDIRSRELAFDE
jgi:hypothetical protein